jgi:hypothetical protein
MPRKSTHGIEKHHLVKLRVDHIDPAMLEALAEDMLFPDIAYRVLHVASYGNEPRVGEDLVWLGQNKFSPTEIDAFDPDVSFDDKKAGIYEDVSPVPVSYVRRIYD